MATVIRTSFARAGALVVSALLTAPATAIAGPEHASTGQAGTRARLPPISLDIRRVIAEQVSQPSRRNEESPQRRRPSTRCSNQKKGALVGAIAGAIGGGIVTAAVMREFEAPVDSTVFRGALAGAAIGAVIGLRVCS